MVALYSGAFGVDLSEVVPPNGDGAYPSFDSFFTRPLRPNARTFDRENGSLLSPADGRLEALGRVTPDGQITVKNRPYSAHDLLCSAAEASRYVDGQYAVIYLSPRDYHRVHAPIAGQIVEIRSAPGDLFPVNAIGMRHIPAVLVRNRRVAIAIDTAQAGRVTVVMVAAMLVGRITVTGLPYRDVASGTHEFDPPRNIALGDEVGVFHLGSTVVLFAEPRMNASFSRTPGPIRSGDPLGEPIKLGDQIPASGRSSHGC